MRSALTLYSASQKSVSVSTAFQTESQGRVVSKLLNFPDVIAALCSDSKRCLVRSINSVRSVHLLDIAMAMFVRRIARGTG